MKLCSPVTLLIQFGHNDAGPINTGKERAELRGAGPESKVFKMQSTGRYHVVYTFGWYMRKFIMDAREKGAVPVLITHTPRNKFDNGFIESNTDSFGAWTKEVADAMGVVCIDLNTLAGQTLQHIADDEGLKKVNAHFKRDHTHSSILGARLNASIVAEELKKIIDGLQSRN